MVLQFLANTLPKGRNGVLRRELSSANIPLKSLFGMFFRSLYYE
jgi:hypothetical protein